MATVNLGRIKFVWQGAYSGATAYVADDVVSYNGSSYICILASTNNLPTNATYWSIMSSAGTNGTNGTDLGTTLTTQGDIVYRNASGLARLGAGTNGQVLTTAGAGANPSWSTIQSGLIKVGTFEDTTRRALAVAGDTPVYSFTYNKVQNATTSKLIIIGSIPGYSQYSNTCGLYFDCLTAGITSHNTNDSFAFKGVYFGNSNGAGQTDFITITKTYEDASNLGSGNHTFEWGWKPRNGSTSDRPYEVINYNSSDDARQHQTSSVFQVFEVTI